MGYGTNGLVRQVQDMHAESKSNKNEIELVMEVAVRAMLDQWLGNLLFYQIVYNIFIFINYKLLN